VPPRGFMYAYSAPSNTAKFFVEGEKRLVVDGRVGEGRRGAFTTFLHTFVLVLDPFQVINNYSRSSGSASTTFAGRRQPAVPKYKHNDV